MGGRWVNHLPDCEELESCSLLTSAWQVEEGNFEAGQGPLALQAVWGLWSWDVNSPGTDGSECAPPLFFSSV